MLLLLLPLLLLLMLMLMLKYYVQFAPASLWKGAKGLLPGWLTPRLWAMYVFVVVYDVASNFLQLIACSTNTNGNDNNNQSRHLLAALIPLFALSRFLHFMFAFTLI